MTEKKKRSEEPTPIARSYCEMCDRCDELAQAFDAAKVCGDLAHAKSLFMDLKSIATEWGIGIQLVEIDNDE